MEFSSLSASSRVCFSFPSIHFDQDEPVEMVMTWWNLISFSCRISLSLSLLLFLPLRCFAKWCETASMPSGSQNETVKHASFFIVYFNCTHKWRARDRMCVVSVLSALFVGTEDIGLVVDEGRCVCLCVAHAVVQFVFDENNKQLWHTVTDTRNIFLFIFCSHPCLFSVDSSLLLVFFFFCSFHLIFYERTFSLPFAFGRSMSSMRVHHVKQQFCFFR